MKRTAIDHPKLKRLGRLLGKPAYQVVGVVESLWHFTARHAIQGDIGKWSDVEIADAIEWEGEPAALIAALIDSRLVDVVPGWRLVIHDWHEHCDDGVKKTVKNKGLAFASLSGKVAKSCETSRNGNPKPEPEPEPEPPAIARAQSQSQSRTSGVFKKLSEPDLRDTSKLREWRDEQLTSKRPVVSSSERDFLFVVAAAERALEKGTEPLALFKSLIGKGRRDLISGEQEDRAAKRIKAMMATGPPSSASAALAETFKPPTE